MYCRNNDRLYDVCQDTQKNNMAYEILRDNYNKSPCKHSCLTSILSYKLVASDVITKKQLEKQVVAYNTMLES